MNSGSDRNLNKCSGASESRENARKRSYRERVAFGDHLSRCARLRFLFARTLYPIREGHGHRPGAAESGRPRRFGQLVLLLGRLVAYVRTNSALTSDKLLFHEKNSDRGGTLVYDNSTVH